MVVSPAEIGRPAIHPHYDAGMSTQTNRFETERLALTADEVAHLLGVSTRHIWALNASGRLPRPLRFGRSVRWRADELREWLAAGAPERPRWEQTRE